MREYDEATLKKLQRLELGILKDFVKVCEENNFTYFGMSGTGIGAVRHGGFIPWDDDIDIAIIREDYDKLVEIFERDYSDKYYILNSEKCDTYPMMTTRICLKDSRFVEYAYAKVKDCPLGIFLDVYPLDHVAVDPKEKAKQEKKAWFLSKFLIMKHIPFPVLAFKGVKAKIIHVITWCIWAFLNVFRISHKFLYKRIIAVTRKYNSEPCEEYGFLTPSKIGIAIYPKKDIFPLQKLKFEDTEINFCHELDKLLTREYGDYMKLPPVEKRKNHMPYILKFPDEEKTQTEVTV